jgi:polar amino acid transport system substrate-binding protein
MEFLMRFVLRSALLLALAILPFTQVQAGDVLDRIAKTNTIRVGMTGSQPPFNVTNRDGELIGMEVDLANLLASAMGVELDIVEMPFDKLLPALEQGKVDLVMSQVTATLERNRRVAFVGPYYISGKSLLTKSSTLATIQSAAEINQPSMRIATLKGSTGETFVARRIPQATLVPTSDYNAAVELLLDGEVDVFLADAPIIKLTAMRYPNAELAVLNKPLTMEPIGIAVSPDDPLLLNLVQNYLEALEVSGGLKTLLNKWFENAGWLTQLP